MSALLKLPAFRIGVVALVGFIFLLPLVIVNGAMDMFLKIEGVPGESQDLKHKDWIELLSYSHGISRPITGSGAGRQTGIPQYSDVTVTKVIDKSSPLLMLNCSMGTVHPSMIIEMRRPSFISPSAENYVKYTLQNVLISSFRPSGSASSGDAVPTESISLNFTQMDMYYADIDSLSGATYFETNVSCTVSDVFP